MKLEELIELARRKAFVRWNKSGVYERLSWDEANKVVLARSITKGGYHVLRTLGAEVDCVEVKPDATVVLQDLFKKPSWQRPGRNPKKEPPTS